MNQEQFGQFWEQLKAPLQAKWEKITEPDLLEIQGNLATFARHSTEALWGIARGRSEHVSQATLCLTEAETMLGYPDLKPAVVTHLSVQRASHSRYSLGMFDRLGQRRGVESCERSSLTRAMNSFASVIRRSCVYENLDSGTRCKRSILVPTGLPPRSPQEPKFNQCGKLIPRDDQMLAQVVEELGVAANGFCAELKVVAIPDDVRWEIQSIDGQEQISEVHRTWA